MINRLFLALIFLSMILAIDGKGDQRRTTPPSDLSTFPDAVGFGIKTRAGRGGRLIRVTNLNNAGFGSLRAAVESDDSRVVVFDTSGQIKLSSQLVVKNAFITIAGQTAPSPGITIAGGGIVVRTHDVLIQHLRIRPGEGNYLRPDEVDSINVGYDQAYNVIFDHLSVSWSIDENMTSWGNGVHDVSWTNNIVSEALYHSVHSKGKHGMGMLVTPNAKNFFIANNLLFMNMDRNPLISNGASVVFANNIVFGWEGGRATDVANPVRWQRCCTQAAIINNHYIRASFTATDTYAIGAGKELINGSKIYLSGNKLENFTDPDKQLFRNITGWNPIVSASPLIVPGFNPIPADQLQDTIIKTVGARPQDRDAVDKRVIAEFHSRKGKFVNRQSEVGGYPALAVNQIAREYPASTSDGDGDGYSDLEEVLFMLSRDLETDLSHRQKQHPKE